MSYVKNSFRFCASLCYLTYGKNFMFIRPADPEILGGWGGFPPPLDAIKLSKRADAINRYEIILK